MEPKPQAAEAPAPQPPDSELPAPDPSRYEQDRRKVEDGLWKKLRRTVGRIPFAEEALAAYYCAVDPRTPFRVKAILMGALAYFVVPTDMVPDFIALLGYGDDATVLAAALRMVLPHVNDDHRAAAREKLGDEGLDARLG